jgi:hypothetical protein
MAWTTDVEKARWFARRASLISKTTGKGDGVVVEALVPPDGVLAALFGERREAEIVVDPRTLTGLRRLEVAPWIE